MAVYFLKGVDIDRKKCNVFVPKKTNLKRRENSFWI